MFKLEIHKCDQNPVEVYVHKFKTEIKQKMMDDFCTKYATTYNSTKKKFLVYLIQNFESWCVSSFRPY